MKRIMGLDVGSKRLGVALSDPLALCANPWGCIEVHAMASVLAQVKKIIEDYSVAHIVVGLPRNMNGSLGFQAEKAQEFAAELEKIDGIEVSLYDERLSSREVENLLIDAGMSRKKRRGVTDKLAATVILQSFLDSRKRESETADE